VDSGKVKKKKKKIQSATISSSGSSSSSSSKTSSTSKIDNSGDIAGAEMRGYKLTSDGKTTSYFTREISEQDKAILAATNAGPQKIDSKNPAPLSASPPHPSGSASTWNSAPKTKNAL
jgi:hypothetical protein